MEFYKRISQDEGGYGNVFLREKWSENPSTSGPSSPSPCSSFNGPSKGLGHSDGFAQLGVCCEVEIDLILSRRVIYSVVDYRNF